ncbi:hypothetical protein JOC77_003983 [Peribacillus deserti]|uniref:Uncharacterized protein n=1 Tax=Peribacillus deserti TaxID=673318 RepID=A0ABS2QMX1_9BACI|nr:hypothetical protein [Peribacillus deserti]MBM7694520.1 hypothetical protein [Peribacillus deserti]
MLNQKKGELLKVLFAVSSFTKPILKYIVDFGTMLIFASGARILSKGNPTGVKCERRPAPAVSECPPVVQLRTAFLVVLDRSPHFLLQSTGNLTELLLKIPFILRHSTVTIQNQSPHIWYKGGKNRITFAGLP